MTTFVLRRLLASVPVLFASSLVVFVLVASGDPLSELRSRPTVPRETVESRARVLHLDRSVAERYAIWAGGLVRGELGRTVAGEDVGKLIGRAAPVTATLVLAAVLLAVIGSVVLGSAQARWRNSWADHAGTFVAVVLLSLPVIWLSGIVKDLASRVNLALGTRIFFVVGTHSPFATGGFLSTATDRAGHLVLPAATLAMLLVGEWSRFLRLAMVEELDAEYVRTARAKGVDDLGLTRHVLRNALGPLTAVASLGVARLIGGAVVIEKVFEWKGMSNLLLSGLRDSDVNLVMGWLLVGGVAVVVCNLLADVAGAWLDPRIRGA